MFLTGGAIIGLKLTRPGQSIGVGILHWFKEVLNSVSYYVVEVLKP